MRQLSASAISEAALEPASMFSPDFIAQLRSAVDELENSHHQADSVRGGASGRASPAPRLATDSFLSPQGSGRGGPAGPQHSEWAGTRTGPHSREKARVQRGLAAEVAAAAAAAAEEADFERWGYRSGYAGSGREEGPGSMASTARSGKGRGSETVRRTAMTVEEQMMHDVDVRGMKALMAMQVTSDHSLATNSDLSQITILASVLSGSATSDPPLPCTSKRNATSSPRQCRRCEIRSSAVKHW